MVVIWVWGFTQKPALDVPTFFTYSNWDKNSRWKKKGVFILETWWQQPQFWRPGCKFRCNERRSKFIGGANSSLRSWLCPCPSTPVLKEQPLIHSVATRSDAWGTLVPCTKKNKHKCILIPTRDSSVVWHVCSVLLRFQPLNSLKNEISRGIFPQPLKVGWGQSLSPVDSCHVPLQVAQWDLSHSDYSANW